MIWFKGRRSGHRLTTILLARSGTVSAATIPAVDEEPPELHFRISGPGIGRIDMYSNDDADSPGATTSHIELDPGGEYRFVVTASDPAGVARVVMHLPAGIGLQQLAPARLASELRGPFRHLVLVGDRQSPMTALSISGRMVMPAANDGAGVPLEFACQGDDFGGQAGRPNHQELSVTATIGAA